MLKKLLVKGCVPSDSKDKAPEVVKADTSVGAWGLDQVRLTHTCGGKKKQPKTDLC